MNKVEYNAETLSDLLPVYYRRLFPHSQFYRWLSYGDQLTFAKREISFTLLGEVYIRYQSFDSQNDFTKQLYKKYPIKIDLGAIYQTKPKDKGPDSKIIPAEKEIIFDIDMTDYDEVRTCCSGADVCTKCWKFMVIACEILDDALRIDFGYKHRLWVFSGRRGIHCWVCDQDARKVNEEARSALADYLHVVKGGANVTKKVDLSEDIIHHSIRRALKIINRYLPTIVEEQDILGTEERFNNFLKLIDQDIRPSFETPMKRAETSSEKWNIFEETFNEMLRNNKIPKHLRNLKEEIKLYYAYLRLDINVTKGLIHLLKAPFCVHPKTGKVCVPFDANKVDCFNPNTVPTIHGLIEEIENYGQKIKDSSSTEIDAKSKIEDYKKTSLVEGMTVFENFLKGFEKNANKEQETEDSKKNIHAQSMRFIENFLKLMENPNDPDINLFD
ncbi:unnamed protein product [Psylliodes chrysocephalus]|uniref:DNA primase n=1 Tax=Psylliodes chrysocephalus TaxID=3402493 RepID=A0A9P0CPU8_9CUCU|nr:unnamed protein product [Psylliodes chrysocephala]